jgi:branched-subunit amino acid transport protein
MSSWIIILGMGLITHSQRLSMILTSGRLTIGEPLKRALRFAPPAVLSAIILPEMLQPGGRLDFSLGNERLLAGLVAIAVSWRTRNMVLTVVIGMVTLWILQFINRSLLGM